MTLPPPLFASLLSASLALSTSALAAERKVESRPIGPFSSIEVSGGVRLLVNPSEVPTLTIEGEAEEIATYRTEVKNGRLIIEPTQKSRVMQRREVEVTVGAKALKQLDASGGVDVTLKGGTAPALALELSGGVHLVAKTLDLETLGVDASGGVDLELGGRAKSVKLDVSGGVKADARGLETQKTALDASGGCSLHVRASQTVSGSASGAASVTVHGKPVTTRVETSGMGSLSFGE